MTKIYHGQNVNDRNVNDRNVNDRIIYRKMVSNNCDELQLSEYIKTIPTHSYVLNPVACIKEDKQIYLEYNVSSKGMTLRRFILDEAKVTNNNRLTKRITGFLHHKKHLNPIQTLLQLIDGYEFLLNKHLLTNQSNISPDCIWIEPDEHGHLTAFVINTIESLTNVKSLNTTYWSPEMLCKYNHAAFYNDTPEGHYESIYSLASKLSRYDTRPSTISAVYSLGLILYFIVAKREPFEGTRVNVYEKPPMHYIHDEHMKRNIFTALDSDVRERPTLQQYREYLLDTNISCCVIL